MEYRIIDEPRAGLHPGLSVNPFWILLAVMLCGAWLAWPWFVLNSFAIGSATRARELALVAAGLVGAAALIFGIGALADGMALDRHNVQYLFLPLVVWKLGIGYFVHVQQNRSFELHEYFGGVSRNGMLIVIVGFLARGSVFSALRGLNAFWALLLG